MEFTEEQKQEMLAYARRILNQTIKASMPEEEDCPDSNLLEKAGVFVSLHKEKELRGCIGYIEPISSVWEAVRENTISAATKDPRFSEVKPEELNEIKIEISVLTPAKECQLDEIETGKDGVIIQSGINKATYLPQVWESFPNKDDFFSTLCEKAGLPTSCWQSSSTKFYKYQAIVFYEKSIY